MLEILFLIYLSARIGKIVAAKGQPKGKYQLALVGMWIGGEILGALIGTVVSKTAGGSLLITYLFALLGAAAGAWGAFRIAHSLPDVTAEGAQPRKPLPTGASILTCVLAMALGSLAFQSMVSWLYPLARSLGLEASTMQIVVNTISFIIFFALTGLVLGGVFTGWTRMSSWAGWFALAGLLAGLVNTTLPVVLPKSSFVYPLVWGIIGAIFALCFGYLVQREPGYQDSNPLVPLLLFGFVGYFLLILAYNWLYPTYIAPKSWAYQAGLGLSVLLGLIEGLIIGLGLEIPRLIRPGVVQADQLPTE